MKPNIQTHEDEKMLLECQPKTALALYTTLPRAVILFIVLIAIIAGGSNSMTQTSTPEFINTYPKFITIGICAYVICILAIYLWSKFIIKRHWYFFTNQRCILYSGYFGINKRIIPYTRVVDVDLRQNPIQAWLNITSVYVDEQSINISLRNKTIVNGLSMEDAEKITHIISEYISKR